MDTAMQVLSMNDLAWVEALYGDPIEFLAGTVRGGITAPDGYELVVADLSSIESRFVGWLTGCKWINETFAARLDTYKRFAVSVFNVAYDEVTKQQRKFAKPAVLAGPYGQGAKGLQEYAEDFGVTLTEEEAQHHIKTFRQTCREIPRFWRWLEYAIQGAIVEGIGVTGSSYRLDIFTEGEFLFIRLPSGRRIPYHLPKIEMKETPWGEIKPTLTFMGTNRFKPSNPWERVKAHMGMITENIVQAGARDILVHGLMLADANGVDIRGHVHDEVIALSKQDKAENCLQVLRMCMSETPYWAPGLLLAAEGYTAKHYTKT